MDVRLATPVSKKLSYEEAATIGVGTEVCMIRHHQQNVTHKVLEEV